MIIRRAKIGDELGMHEAHRRSIREVCSRDYSEEQLKVWADHDFNEENRRQSILKAWSWVVEDQGKIKGVAILNKTQVDNEDCGDLRLLYFTPEIIGQGFGRKMIFEIEKKAKELGWRKILLSSTVTAKGFYEANGYQTTGPQTHLVWSGVKIESIPMCKEL